MTEQSQRDSDDYANWSLKEVEAIFDSHRGNADRFIRRTAKEIKGTKEHKEFGAAWNDVAYSDDLKPLDTKALNQAVKTAKDKKWTKRKDRFFVPTVDFEIPQNTIVGFVYMIRFAKGFYYIGETQNLNARMGQHKARWKSKVMNLVNRVAKEAKPEDLAHAKAPLIRDDRLLEALRKYFIASGEISKGTKQLTKAIRKGKVTEKHLDSALKDITTNHVVLLDLQVEGEDDRLFNYKASERWHIGLLNSMEYELINHNFADYSLMETAHLMKNKEHNFKYPWEATLAEAPVGYDYEVGYDEIDGYDETPW